MPNLNQFITAIKVAGLQKQNRFAVNIYRGSIGTQSAGSPNADSRFISLMADSVTVPGMNFSTAPVFTFGEPREVVYNRNFDPVQMTVYGDREMTTRQYFDEWQRSVMNPNDRTTSYYADYIRQVEILHLDQADNINYKLTLHEVYPKAIAPYDLGNETNTVLRISVQLQYKFYTFSSDKITANQRNPRDRLSIIQGQSPL